MTNAQGPLAGKVVLLTGLSRRIGIAPAILTRLLGQGATVFATGWTPHDDEMPWGADPVDMSEHPADRFHHVEADLADPSAPAELVAATIDRFGWIDAVVADHARSSHDPLAEVTVEELDACWAINTRASLLLAKELGAQRDGPRPGGRVVLFTSGQHRSPMSDEIAYAVSKGAIREMTLSVADALADLGITVNCINPGPVDTGYAKGDAHQSVRLGFPAQRWGTPDDVARIVAWLVGDESEWITGQCIDSDGGWRGPVSQIDMATRLSD